MKKKDLKLGCLHAIWYAFRDKDISFYPLIVSGQKESVETLPISQIVSEISAVVSKLDADDSTDIEEHLKRGRESLDEVKALTEYQDQKATRLLTIVAFLSALSGALFTKFADIYPFRATVAQFGIGMPIFMVLGSYALFAIFILSAISGALVIFHATRTQFKYPKTHSSDQSGAGTGIGSYLFYSDIVSMTPALWAKSFVHSKGFVRAGGGEEEFEIDPKLPIYYFRNYILETYLIACKVADKLRYLQPAQTILSFSIRVLLAWVLVMGSTLIFVGPPRPSSPPAQPHFQKPAGRLLITDDLDNPVHSLAVQEGPFHSGNQAGA